MRKLMSLILTVSVFLSIMPITLVSAEVVDSGSCGTNLIWELDDSGTLTINGTGTMSRVWTNDTNITRVVITNGATNIGSYTFSGCSNLTSITLPDSIRTIGDCAFEQCSNLTSVNIPNSVTYIGNSAFSGCSSLTNVNIPNGVSYIRNFTFALCSSLTSINLSDEVKIIGDAAFMGCSSLKNIDIPNNVTSIGDNAFALCSALTSITVPNSVMSIGDDAFASCSALTSITIPDSVTSIGGGAFASCSALTSITIPDSVTSIGDYIFEQCSSLISINIPDSVTSIGSYAFYGCSSLTNITIPNSVISIGDYTFSGCSSSIQIIGVKGSQAEIYAQKHKIKFIALSQITFVTNGGSKIQPIVGIFGVTIAEPASPIREEAIFQGWYTDIELTQKYEFTTMPAEDITLYAKWAVNQYTISFNSNGGSDVPPISQEYSSSITEPETIKLGYTLIGWYTDKKLTQRYEFTTMPAEDITLYAKWKINQYSITFNSNGGNNVFPIKQDYGTTVTAPKVTKAGYTLIGWYTDKELTQKYEFTTMPAENITLYAKWNINQYTVTFNSNGGSSISPIMQDYGTVITAPILPTKEESIFQGWYTDRELTQKYEFTTMPAENITLYAKWKVNQYTITFNSNDGSDVSPITKDYGSDIITPKPVKDGYTFVGWYTDKELTQKYEFTTMPASNIMLYAKWEINQYTMSFETNGGEEIQPITQDYDTYISKPETRRTGYTLIDWYSDSQLTQKYTIVKMPAENIKLYAKWEINRYTITFETNGGKSINPITQNFNTKVNEPKIEKDGCIFLGWYADEGLTQKYEFTTMPAENITLYAKWKSGGEITDTLKWYFDEETETVYIQGEGDMPNYKDRIYGNNDSTPPWDYLGNKVKNMVFGSGITSIGDHNIWTDKLTSVKNIKIPDTVKRISVTNDFKFSNIGMPTSWFCFICSYESYAAEFASYYVNVSCLYIDNEDRVYPAIPSAVAGKPSGEYYYVFNSIGEYKSLKSYTEGAEIYYTTDGSDPYTNGKLYTEPFQFKPMTIKTVTSLDGYKDCTSEYTFYEAVAPKNLKVQSITASTANLKFDKPEGVENVDVYIHAESDESWVMVEDANKDYDADGNVKVMGLTPETEYVFKVSCSYNGGGALDSNFVVDTTKTYVSSACSVIDTKVPFMAQVNEKDKTITGARYANKYGSLGIDVNVSDGATWKLYTDKELKNPAVNNILPLSVEGGNNYGYIQVTAEDGLTTKTYQLVVYRQSKSSPPTFSITQGAVRAGTPVSIYAKGETIKYTVDNSSPGEFSGNIYTEPIIINNEIIIKASAKENDKDEYSDVVTVKYTIGDPEENVPISVSYINNVVTTELSETVTGGTIIAAIYTNDDKLVGVKCEKVDIDRSIRFPFFESGDYAKVFWWNSLSGMIPKAEPIVENHTK